LLGLPLVMRVAWPSITPGLARRPEAWLSC